MRYNLETPGFTPTGNNDAQVNRLCSVESDILCQVSDSDIFFAKERLGLHKSTPEEGVSLSILKNYIHKKYAI